MNKLETRRAIHSICTGHGIEGPLVKDYDNVATAAFRNRHFHRVLVTINYDDTFDEINEKIKEVNGLGFVEETNQQPKKYEHTAVVVVLGKGEFRSNPGETTEELIARAMGDDEEMLPDELSPDFERYLKDCNDAARGLRAMAEDPRREDATPKPETMERFRMKLNDDNQLEAPKIEKPLPKQPE